MIEARAAAVGMDLVFQFDAQALNLTPDSAEATLTGNTFDGVPIKGTDSVNIVPKGKE